MIVIASTAVLLLALEEKTYRKPWVGKKKVMQNDDVSSREDPNQASTKWYKRILNMVFSPLRRNLHGQGWVQAGTKDEWDSGDEFIPPKHSMATVSTTFMSPKEYDSSLNTGESSTACHLPQNSRMNSFSSDRSTTLPFDVPYTDLYAPSLQYAIPSVQSISIPSPTSYSYQPTCVISTVTSNPVTISTPIPASPQTIEVVPSEDTSHSDNGTQVPLQSPTSIRTFDRGTKFIEAL